MVVSPGCPSSTVLWPAPHTSCLPVGTLWTLHVCRQQFPWDGRGSPHTHTAGAVLPTNLLFVSKFLIPGDLREPLGSEGHKSLPHMIRVSAETWHYKSLLLQVTLPVVWCDLNILTSSGIWFTAVVFHTDYSSVAWKVIHNDRSCALLAGIQRANEGHGGGSLCFLHSTTPVKWVVIGKKDKSAGPLRDVQPNFSDTRWGAMITVLRKLATG